MAQNTNVSLAVIRYSRADFTALRAVMSKVAIERILDLYYCEDDRDLLGLETTADLRLRMDKMRDFLIQRASDANPHVAEFLQDARRTSLWSPKAIDFLVQAADMKMSSPRPEDPLTFWFRRQITDRFKEEGCKTIEELATMVNRRGHGWYRPIPRLGKRKAQALVSWIQGQRSISDLIDGKSLVPAEEHSTRVILDPNMLSLVPFERIELPSQFSGQNGINRCPDFCLIEASDDRAAIDAYLTKHYESPKTYRSYQKELERYLLWCIFCRRKPMSSILGEDCEAYKLFLENPDRSWVGDEKPYLRAHRRSPNWRPFGPQLSAESRCYAVRIIRSFHTYLVNVRYLAGNPWMAVKDPKVTKRTNKIRIEKAIPTTLWAKLAGSGGIFDNLCTTPNDELAQRYPMPGAEKWFASQLRVARAAILLMGESGLRREEAASATRGNLKPAPESAKGFWELTVIGKGDKERTVFFPGRVVDAIRAHWDDRGTPFDFAKDTAPLFAPVMVPSTQTSKDRHLSTYDQDGLLVENHYTPDAFGNLVSTTLTRISEDSYLDLSYSERSSLAAASAHALRHTFGTKAVADNKPLDVVRFLMGHASLDTTSIYVQAPRKRAIEELEKDYEE